MLEEKAKVQTGMEDGVEQWKGPDPADAASAEAQGRGEPGEGRPRNGGGQGAARLGRGQGCRGTVN